jgi:alanine-synthesizing transaminase
MVENEQRIRQAARGVRRFLESGIETLHNVVPLANRRLFLPAGFRKAWSHP